MNYKLTLLFIFTGYLATFGQTSIELYGGYYKNYFYDNLDIGRRYQSDYTPGNNGYSLGIGIDRIKIERLRLRFTLQYDKYDGAIKVSDGGLGGGYTTKANIDKSLLTFGIFPVNFKILKALDINAGFELSSLIQESFEGTMSGYLLGQGAWSEDIKDKYDTFNNNFYVGLKGRLAYGINIGKDLFLTPQYQFYFGLSNEFIQFPKDTKSMRHYFGVGIEKIINSK